MTETKTTETASPSPPEGSGLAGALARVMGQIRRVPKEGRNDFHGYDYVTEADLVDHIRDKLAGEQVAVLPSVVEHTEQEMKDGRGRVQYRTLVTLEMALIHAPSGEERTTRWVGVGVDAGDKGFYKAYTGAMKYFLLKTFQVSTGDDPEREAVHDREGLVGRGDDSAAALRGRLAVALDEAQEAGLRTSERVDFEELLASSAQVERLKDAPAKKLRGWVKKLESKDPAGRRGMVREGLSKAAQQDEQDQNGEAA